MADRKTLTQQVVERSRETGEPFAPSFDYESDMLGESKREQGYRSLASKT